MNKDFKKDGRNGSLNRDGEKRSFTRNSGRSSFSGDRARGDQSVGDYNSSRRDKYSRKDNNNGSDSRGESSYGRGNGDARGERSYGRGSGDARGERRYGRGSGDTRGERSYGRGNGDARGERSYRRGNDDSRGDRADRNYGNRDSNYNANKGSVQKRSYDRSSSKFKKNYNTEVEHTENFGEYESITKAERLEKSERHYSKKKILEHNIKSLTSDSLIRLNRYLSMGGVCSRRDADSLIQQGRVTVNKEVVRTIGTKVKMSDVVMFDGKKIEPEKKVYLILNKPKDYVTTLDDPLERKTVMSLIKTACKERIYPIGRLDRNTTGVLLFTNDGDLAKKLTHPSYEHKKVYHVFLDRPVIEPHMKEILKGVELDDGIIKADDLSYVDNTPYEVGIEIHSGKNRIVRRIFEHFGYNILKLDRVFFAGMTKKNLPRGKWRMLSKEEVNVLKYY